MAVERIDPFEREDRFCLDHLFRYHWVRPLVAEKNVLDVACGLGFGSILLAHAGAASVTGVDYDEDTINRCRQWWEHACLTYRSGRIEELSACGLDPFDCVTCFETLEHVEDPLPALESVRSVMKPGGLLIGSVPGETDRMEENEFHQHHFSFGDLEALLGKLFANVRIYRQRFHLASVIENGGEPGSEVMRGEAFEALRLDFGRAPSWADSFVFMATDGELPSPEEPSLALSRQAWLEFADQEELARLELQRLSARFREVFFKHGSMVRDHGDLKRRFANTLGWGKYYYQKATGKEPEHHYLEKIEHARSKREAELRNEVERLTRENEDLKKRLGEGKAGGDAGTEPRRRAYLAGLKSTPPPAK
ncbi:MAG: class I SAM-dependent methyltransferase [Oceanipulchritudo sp.]